MPPAAVPRILVVDDEKAVRELLVEALDEFGYAADAVGDGRTALQTLAGGRHGLVLSDIDMPGLNGLALLRAAKERDPDLDFVMVTGVVDTAIAVGTIREGASDYVTKPFNLDEVRLVVERTAEKRRLIVENRRYQSHLEDMVQERTRALEASYESTLQSLVTALDFRDNETQGHSTRVVEYAMMVSRSLGIDEPELTPIRRGALLHDIGKIGVPDAILRKPGKLTEDEWVEMRRHPQIGFEMLRRIPFLESCLPIVRSHQERWDGSGYPDGLRGEAIPLGARIFAVVDTFDAMTSDRPYRAALSIEEARAEVRKFAGSQFDPRVAEAFLAIPADAWSDIRDRVHHADSAGGAP